MTATIERNCPLCKSLGVTAKSPMVEKEQSKGIVYLECEIGHGMNIRTYHFLHAS